MMTLNKRVDMMSDIFDMIELSSGRNAKQEIIDTFIPEELKDDFTFCIEVLAGKHKLGYSLMPDFHGCYDFDKFTEYDYTIEYVYRELMKYGSTYREIDTACRQLYTFGMDESMEHDEDRYNFWVKLCNRQFRLGIGKSLLSVEDTAPMLAELYGKKPRKGYYYVTEKFDGVRCISYYDGNDWLFISRNGKPLNISFNMSEQDTDFIYDGELLIPGKGFNYVDGVVNSLSHPDKEKVTYNIFDVYQNEKTVSYCSRRIILDTYVKENDRVKKVPVLLEVDLPHEEELLMDKFLEVTSRGGEGVMLNEKYSPYRHKRGSHLLKLKDTWRLDMKVVGLKEGKGKYEGKIGSLECEAIDETYGTRYHTFAGGLSDAEREMTDWIGQIVEIECNGKSQNAKTLGSREFSIRHARFIRRRTDKTETSTD